MSLHRKDLTARTFPKLPNQTVAGDYVKSKLEDEVVKKYPEFDLPQISSKIELSKAKRDLQNVEDNLQRTREGAMQRRENLDEQWEDLAHKEELLKNSFITFNKTKLPKMKSLESINERVVLALRCILVKQEEVLINALGNTKYVLRTMFVKENQDKRERAEKATEEEIALQKVVSNKIEETQQKYEEMLGVKHSIEKYIKNYRLYKYYLHTVVRAYPKFKTIDDLLKRYEALREARAELLLRQDSDLTELEDARLDLVKISEEKVLQIMGLNNHLSTLQSRYEAAYNKACYWQTSVARVQSVAFAKIIDLHLLKEACWDIYSQMCKRKQIEPEIKKDDLENQLMFIKKTLVELNYVVKTAKKDANDMDAFYVQGTSVFCKK